MTHDSSGWTGRGPTKRVTPCPFRPPHRDLVGNRWPFLVAVYLTTLVVGATFYLSP